MQTSIDELEKFKEEKRLEDLMTVKIEVPTIDVDLLSKKETMIEDLEREKTKLEAKILQLSSEYHIVLSNSDSLAEKIRIFQSRCVELEAKVKTQE